MIVRIMGEGQLDVAESHLDRLNQLDDELLAALERGDEGLFRTALGNLLTAVREAGSPRPEESLEPSDLILPAADATVEEVRRLLRDDGLIPG
ncbi:PspA-associated protein PspAA [Peterkaempfera bronchialis]|uniref:PspA-associated domain-containing protein n=1 Tax=Peterkaempfera bronchialis TaxID=2126346 RepID=A0A345STV5_9ACTN|nr:hypothetical protein [Peterkaempfera bronchialis]AXI77160.1 hypothetical protein C7M71_006615 [Peterkaempfera bronchialis]